MTSCNLKFTALLMQQGALSVSTVPAGQQLSYRNMRMLMSTLQFTAFIEWQRATRVAHNHLFVYFHTKGMVNYGVLKDRIDTTIYDSTFVPWRAIAKQFIAHYDIRAAAWMPSNSGWGWYNFWWVRGRFPTCIQPHVQLCGHHVLQMCRGKWFTELSAW